MKSFLKWLKENDKEDYFLYIPSMTAQEAINYLQEYLLGEDWYIVDPVNNEQANTIVVGDILQKYSKKFKKELKKYKKEENKNEIQTNKANE